MAGVTLTREFGFSPKATLVNKAAQHADKHAFVVVGVGAFWWLVRDLYRAAGLSLTILLMWTLGVPLLPALGAGMCVPLAAWCQRWWALIDPPKGGLGAAENTSVRSRAWAAGRELWSHGKRARILSRDWTRAAVAAELDDGDSVPQLTGVQRTASGYAAEIACGEVGVPASKVAAKSEELAASIEGCREVVVTPGEVPGLARLEFLWGDDISEPFGLERLPLPPPGRISLGLTSPNGAPLTVSYMKDLLIVGLPGSGKSNAVQAGLASTRAVGLPHELYIVDSPGGVELADLRDSPMTVGYADSVDGAEDVFAQALKDMEARGRRMQGKARVWTPSEAEPWKLILVDEFLLLYRLTLKGVKSPLGSIMSMGRKYGFVLWGITQDPMVETMGALRRLFPQKLVLATESRAMTEVVLGDGAEAMGARCSKIPESDPGTGFAWTEDQRAFRRFRIPYVTNEERALLARGQLPAGCPHSDESTLIRDWVLYAWWSPEGKCIYVGKSNSGRDRATQHLADNRKRLLHRPGVTMRIEASFDTEAEVLEAERRAIEDWSPSENIVHNRELGAA